MKKTKKIIFYGTVQGVGFRFTCKKEAQRFGLTGQVKNELDGSVEVIAQGEDKQISLFLLALTRHTYLAGLIANYDIQEIKAPAYPDFRVAY